MKVGLFAPLANPTATAEYIEALGKGAEERGFDSLWVAEHVVLALQWPPGPWGRRRLAG